MSMIQIDNCPDCGSDILEPRERVRGERVAHTVVCNNGHENLEYIEQVAASAEAVELAGALTGAMYYSSHAMTDVPTDVTERLARALDAWRSTKP